MRRIGSTASSISSAVISVGGFVSANPPPQPRCDWTKLPRTSACITFERYAGGTFVAAAICFVVKAELEFIDRKTIALSAYSAV